MNALVVTDLSETGLLSLEGVRVCGHDWFDRIVVLHVIDLDLYTAGGSVPAISEWAISETGKAAAELRRMGYQADSRVEQGPVVETINRVAEQIDAGLIIMTNVGRGGDRVLGATAERVASSSKRPVLIDRVARVGAKWCRLGDTSLFDTVVAGVDFGPHAIDFMQQTARLPGLKRLVAVHIASDEKERLDSIAALADAAAEMEWPPVVEVSSLTGEPAQMLLTRARDLSANAVAIAPCRHGAVHRAVLGSVAREVLLAADRAVVLVPWG